MKAQLKQPVVDRELTRLLNGISSLVVARIAESARSFISLECEAIAFKGLK